MRLTGTGVEAPGGLDRLGRAEAVEGDRDEAFDLLGLGAAEPGDAADHLGDVGDVDVGADLARRHYAEHEGKAFFGALLEFITSGPVVAAVIEGPHAIAAFRQIAGATNPVEGATPGTIRGDFGLETQFNLVHGSDSPESAQREIALWFPAG